MATKTFSGRAEGEAIAFADALLRREYGLSFGQYCGTVLLDSICETGQLPPLGAGRPVGEEKRRALSFIKGFAGQHRNASVGALSDEEIRDLIASRYE